MKFNWFVLKPDEKPITTTIEYFDVRGQFEELLKSNLDLQKKLGFQRKAGQKQDPDELQMYERLEVETEQMRWQFFRRQPVVLIALCPYCNVQIWQSVGVFSLVDEFWYRKSSNGRAVAKASRRCPHLFCVDGALNLNGHQPTEQQRPITAVLNENITMAAEVPFVKPRVLNLPTMRAVVHSFPVAERYTAYPIVYFAEKLPAEHINFCIPWASTAFDGMHPYANNQEIGFTGKRSDRQEYDLTQWIEKGKLLWVEPENEDKLIGGPVQAFPYAQVAGRRHPYYLEEGAIHDLPDPVEGKPEIILGDIYR